MFDPVPAGAEKLDLFDHAGFKRVPSQFVHGRTALVDEFHCPACRTEQALPQPFKATACIRCGLMMRASISHLHIWRAEPAAATE